MAKGLIIEQNNTGHEIGDLVFLKGGSPQATVMRIDGEHLVIAWVDHALHVHSMPAHFKSLRKEFVPDLDTAFMPDRK